MSELRRDPITGRWTVVAPGRAPRPNEYPKRPPPSSSENCPFCEGHESWTPAEVATDRPAGRPANGPGWTVRAIPNKFPTLAPEVETEGPADAASRFAHRPGRGFHEVIIETPDHAARLATLSVSQARTFLRVLRDRVRWLAAQPGIASLVVFENSGPESGGSLFHPHAQVVAVPEVVPTLAEELGAASAFARTHSGRCIFEEVLAQERAAGTRLVREIEGWTAYCPFASELPYEVRVVPHRHSSSFGETTDAEIEAAAELFPSLLRRFEEVAPDASYNFVARAPAEGQAERSVYHWHLDLLPRLIRPDGFEVGGGIHVNPFAPETAARELRSAAHRNAVDGRSPAEEPPKG